MDDGTVCIFHLASPPEKLWGMLLRRDRTGVTLRGLNLSSFDDWARQVVSGGEPTLGPATMFVPMRRIERIFVDERVGAVESYRDRLERRLGTPVEELLG